MKSFVGLLTFAAVASAVDHAIQVGGGGNLAFSPSTVTAAENDTITFTFMDPFVHSVTQSTFQNPCTIADGGFNSGLQNPGNSFTITITNQTMPIWFYCEQTSPLMHCGMGMVGAINPPTTGNTFDNFQAAASALGTNEPPQTAGAALSGLGAFATASAGPAASGASSGTAAASGTAGSTGNSTVSGAAPTATGSGVPSGSGVSSGVIPSATTPTGGTTGNTTTTGSGAVSIGVSLAGLIGAIIGASSLM